MSLLWPLHLQAVSSIRATQSEFDEHHIVRFADDSEREDEGPMVIQHFWKWRQEAFLQLNLTKTEDVHWFYKFQSYQH